ncbi:hypothetical protein FTO70_09630 [Methanosarcina sp. KYL-1]|uniref:hypothetical protein n=1 Tax=Methanosarcina sp. KYL-1 TaxID=2602068 RepID=UPI0021011869|nr:hypothetical protein [Methanosarcina sp. KYL-1]MCQ1535934.1 hypothetical protein [Methanosarcina sp. KYL-1]
MDLTGMIETNFTILIGVFVTLVVMGTATLYDKYQREGKISFNPGEFNPFSALYQKLKSFGFEGSNGFSVYGKKLSSLIQRIPNKNKHEHAEIKSLKSITQIQKLFGNLLTKISSFSFTLPGKGNKRSGRRFDLSSDNKTKASKFGGAETVNAFNIDKIVEAKKDELDFDDDLLTEMSTGSSFKDSSHAVSTVDPFFGEASSDIGAALNSDLMFDDNEFDIGFGAMEDESSEDDLLFSTGSEDLNFGDESDSLLDSLKKDIVITKEEKIDFMADMRGENLDLKLLKSDLEDVLGNLKKYRQHSNHN